MPHVPQFKSDGSASGLAKWQTDTSYAEGDFVYINSEDITTSFLSGIFVCISTHVSSEFDTDISNWRSLTAGYLHTQSAADDIWTVNHGLYRYPSVTIIDSNKYEIEGSVQYTSLTSLTIRLNSAESGFAYCV